MRPFRLFDSVLRNLIKGGRGRAWHGGTARAGAQRGSPRGARYDRVPAGPGRDRRGHGPARHRHPPPIAPDARGGLSDRRRSRRSAPAPGAGEDQPADAGSAAQALPDPAASRDTASDGPGAYGQMQSIGPNPFARMSSDDSRLPIILPVDFPAAGEAPKPRLNRRRINKLT